MNKTYAKSPPIRQRPREHRSQPARVVLALSLDGADLRILRAALALFRRRNPQAGALLERIGRAAA